MILRKQLVASFSSVFITGITGIIFIPVLTRLLSPEDIGRLFLILTFATMMMILEGVRPVVIHAMSSGDYKKSHQLKRINFYLSLMFTLILMVVFNIVLKFSVVLSLLYSSVYFFFSLMAYHWGIIDAMGKVSFTSLVRAASWVVCYIFFVVFALLGIDIELYILPILLMNLVIFLIFRKVSSKKIEVIRNSTPKERDEGKFDWQVLSTIFMNIKVQAYSVFINNYDKLFVPYFLGNNLFGYYAVQSNIVSRTYLINTAYRQVITPHFSNPNNRKELKKAIGIIFLSFSLAVITLSALVPFVESFIIIYAGQSYAAHSYVLQIAIFSFPLNMLGALGVALLQSAGDFRAHEKACLHSLVVSCPIFIVLVYFLGLQGAAWGLLCTRAVDIYVLTKGIDKNSKSSGVMIFYAFFVIYLLYVYLLINQLNTLYIFLVALIYMLYKIGAKIEIKD